MKLNELISDFEIALTNEERKVLEKMEAISPLDSYLEREQFIIEGLIRKSIVSKVIQKNQTLVMKNGYELI